MKTLEADQRDERKKTLHETLGPPAQRENCSFPTGIPERSLLLPNQRLERTSDTRTTSKTRPTTLRRSWAEAHTHTTQECRTAHRGKCRRHQTGRVTGRVADVKIDERKRRRKKRKRKKKKIRGTHKQTAECGDYVRSPQEPSSLPCRRWFIYAEQRGMES